MQATFARRVISDAAGGVLRDVCDYDVLDELLVVDGALTVGRHQDVVRHGGNRAGGDAKGRRARAGGGGR
jgi:hypothetical protein